MANKESTAVNDLIAAVQTGRPAASPSDDLFSTPRPTRGQPPRVTATIPPMKGAGEVAPLPRGRAPSGTSQHKLPQIPPPVRITTAPGRARTIPPLTRPAAPQVPGRHTPPPPPTRPSPSASQTLPSQAPVPPVPFSAAASASMPASPASSAAVAKTNLPASTMTTLQGHAPPEVPALPKLKGPRTTGATRTAPPASAPVAAPFDHHSPNEAPNASVAKALAEAEALRLATIDQTGDAVAADGWFESSRMVDRIEDDEWLGTSQTPKAAPRSELLKKLIAPAITFVIIGALVGGYIAFAGEHASHAKKAAPVAVAARPAGQDVTTAIPPSIAREQGNAATATAGAAQPEPPPAAETAPARPQTSDLRPQAEDRGPKTEDQSPKPEAPAIAEAAPVVHEVKTTQGIVKLVDVRIDSKPAGATVMLVDNGKTSFLGTTPVAASVDPSRAYDVIVTLEGRTTQMAHFDPNKTHRVDLVLGKGNGPAKQAPVAVAAEKPEVAPAPPPAPKAAPAKTEHHHSSHAKLAEPSFDSAAAEKAEPAPEAPKAEAPKAEGGNGTLMVSSKPPCEIYVDGEPTGLSTPQRALPLPAGAHKITFVNSAENVKKTVAVKITAGQSTKLIQNFMP